MNPYLTRLKSLVKALGSRLAITTGMRELTRVVDLIAGIEKIEKNLDLGS